MSARSWESVRAEGRRNRVVDQERLAQNREQLLAQIRAHRLAELRESQGLTQVDVAGRIGVTQSRISHMERGEIERTGIVTIRNYVEALGGEVEVIAKFGDERIVIG